MAVIEIQTCGMYGADNLFKSTVDGWTFIITEPQTDDEPFEKYLVHWTYLVDPDKKTKTFVAKDGACELRAYGFSETGNSFIVASSCELTIYGTI
jgi:hypothetical protein